MIKYERRGGGDVLKLFKIILFVKDEVCAVQGETLDLYMRGLGVR